MRWEPIRQWSGRGSQALDSFQSETGALRIDWAASKLPNSHGEGVLRITIHSAISGRPLSAAVVDHRGEGKGTAFVSEEPRVFFADIVSENVAWTIAIFERVN